MFLKKNKSLCSRWKQCQFFTQYYMFVQLAMFCANVACSKDTIHVQCMLCDEDEQNHRKGTV